MRSSPSAASGLALAAALLAVAVPARAQSDPPAEIGGSYSVDGVTYSPVDAPFDDVGLARLDGAPTAAVSAAHRTLPIPSYVEVTALDSGRTILARVERRGPMSGGAAFGLSLAGFGQLGADPATPLAVRVRRVSPQEYERALLRTGQTAPERLPTPKPLLEVLRKLYAAKSAAAAPAPSVSAPPAPVAAAAEPAAAPKPAPSRGAFAVQAGVFANKANAEVVAKKLGAVPTAAGKLWLVRLGPFATRPAAEAALARAKRAGLSDARILAAGK